MSSTADDVAWGVSTRAISHPGTCMGNISTNHAERPVSFKIWFWKRVPRLQDLLLVRDLKRNFLISDAPLVDTCLGVVYALGPPIFFMFFSSDSRS